MASGGLGRVVVCESNLDVLQTPAGVRYIDDSVSQTMIVARMNQSGPNSPDVQFLLVW